MKYDKSDVEWYISIQGMHLSAFGDGLWKREGSLKHHDTEWPHSNCIIDYICASHKIYFLCHL